MSCAKSSPCIRTARALESVQASGPDALNPLLGNSPAQTCANLNEVIGLLHSLITSDRELTEIQPGMALILQTVWAAVQFEADYEVTV
jgi:hypothetical protein